jgi:hypothetical protein
MDWIQSADSGHSREFFENAQYAGFTARYPLDCHVSTSQEIRHAYTPVVT